MGEAELRQLPDRAGGCHALIALIALIASNDAPYWAMPSSGSCRAGQVEGRSSSVCACAPLACKCSPQRHALFVAGGGSELECLCLRSFSNVCLWPVPPLCVEVDGGGEGGSEGGSDAAAAAAAVARPSQRPRHAIRLGDISGPPGQVMRTDCH